MTSLIGDKIRKTRKVLHMTQSELSSGICTQSQISKIEKNEIMPSADLLFQLSQRLEVSMDYFFDNEKEVNSMKVRGRKICEDYMLKREYNILLDFVNQQMTSSITEHERKYYSWIKAVCTNYISADTDYCITILMDIIDKKDDVNDPELDANIYNSLSILYFNANQLEEAENMLHRALSTAKSNHIKGTVTNKIYYNLARQAYIKENYHESLRYSDLGINESMEYETSRMLEHLIYIRSAALLEINEITEKDIELYTTGKMLSRMKHDIDLLDLYEQQLTKFKEMSSYEKERI